MPYGLDAKSLVLQRTSRRDRPTAKPNTECTTRMEIPSISLNTDGQSSQETAKRKGHSAKRKEKSTRAKTPSSPGALHFPSLNTQHYSCPLTPNTLSPTPFPTQYSALNCCQLPSAPCLPGSSLCAMRSALCSLRFLLVSQSVVHSIFRFAVGRSLLDLRRGTELLASRP